MKRTKLDGMSRSQRKLPTSIQINQVTAVPRERTLTDAEMTINQETRTSHQEVTVVATDFTPATLLRDPRILNLEEGGPHLLGATTIVPRRDLADHIDQMLDQRRREAIGIGSSTETGNPAGQRDVLP